MITVHEQSGPQHEQEQEEHVPQAQHQAPQEQEQTEAQEEPQQEEAQPQPQLQPQSGESDVQILSSEIEESEVVTGIATTTESDKDTHGFEPESFDSNITMTDIQTCKTDDTFEAPQQYIYCTCKT